MTASSEFSAAFFGTTSQLSGAGLFGLNRNLVKKLLPYTAYAWGLAALPMVYFIPYIPKWRHWITDRKVWFFALWIMPSVGFYILIHMGQQGYVFAFLPACLILSAKGLYGLLGARPALLQASTAVIALVGAGIFIFAPVYPFGPNGPKLLTYATLRESDQIWSDKIAAVRSNFKPDNTLLVAGSWRHIQYYLPEYRFARFVLGSKFEADEGEIVAADFVNQAMPPQELGLTAGEDWRLVVIDDELKTFVREPDVLEKITLPDGFTLSYLTLQPDEDYWTDGQTFGARAASAGQG